MPFGLVTGAAVLSRLLDSVLGDLKYRCVYNYLDDVVIYSATFDDHLVHLSQVMERLKGAGLTVKPSKVSLVHKQISFLGHIVSNAGVAIDQSRTQAIYDFKVPRDKKEVGRFIGMVNFFRKYIPDFARIAAPLNQLRKKNERFCWTAHQQEAFDTLKRALGSAPVLGIPDFNSEFVVQTDASHCGLAAVLLQDREGKREPLAYASRCLSQAEKDYSVYELEALAVLFALEKFRFYLEHKPFCLETDNQALSWVLARPRKAGRIARWAVRISAFKFNVKHIRGAENAVADALSRMFQQHESGADSCNEGEGSPEEKVYAVLTEIPALFNNLKEEQEHDPELGPIRQRIEKGDLVEPYSISRGILCYRTRYDQRTKICLPRSLVPAIFNYFHASLAGGHLGLAKTLYRIREHLTWKGLVPDVKKLMGQCEACKTAKPNPNTRRGLLCSSREDSPMDKIFIDYVGPLPRTRDGYRYVLVAVDAFSRFVWLIPSCSVTSATTIRHLTSIFASFGPPKVLVSDNAAAFLSGQFKKFCFDHSIKQVTTIPYYPNPSFAERVNRNLKSALIIYHSKSQSSWDKTVRWLALAFNSAFHEAHKTTPAQLMLAYPLNSPLSNLWTIGDLLPDKMDAADIKAKWDAARRNITLAHQRQAKRYNQGRQRCEFSVGDVVYVRNFGAQSKGSQGITQKMLPRFTGPFKIIQRISPVSFWVQHSKTRKRMRVHSSQLKADAVYDSIQKTPPSPSGTRCAGFSGGG